MATTEKKEEQCEMDTSRSEEGCDCSERNTKRIRLTMTPRITDVDSSLEHELSSQMGNDDEDLENEDSPYDPEVEMQVEEDDEEKTFVQRHEESVEEVVAGICLLELGPLLSYLGCETTDHVEYKCICSYGRGIAKLLLTILDQEDFELRIFRKALRDQLWAFSAELCEHKDFAAIISADIDLEKYPLLRESHIGFVLKRLREHRSWTPTLIVNPPGLPSILCGFWTKGYDHIVKLVQEVNEECKGLSDDQKMHMLLEFKRGSCLGVLDAVLLDAWKEIEVQRLGQLLRADDEEEGEELGQMYEFQFGRSTHYFLHELVEAKFLSVEIFGSYVTEPLQPYWLGAFSEEVLEVVRNADIRRRWQGQRFVSTSHIFWALKQTRIAAAIDKLCHRVSDCLTEAPVKHPAYGIYKCSHEVASILDAGEVGIEHLALATVLSGGNLSKQDYDAQALSDFLGLEIVKVFLEDVERDKEKEKPDEFSQCMGHSERPPGVSFFEMPLDSLVDKVFKLSNCSPNEAD